MTSAATARDAVRPAGPDAAPPATTAKSKRSYLHHLDLIRATTFGLVIFIHVLTQTTDEVNSIGVTTTGLLLHFTRNTFFSYNHRQRRVVGSESPISMFFRC